MPSALALGLIAGVTEFVPIIGPVIGAIPALLLAFTEDWNTVLWTLAVFVVVQQIENNVIMPLVAGAAVAVPPAVGLFAVVAIGVLFGPLGLLLGYPLAIVIDVAVRRLYVRETLGEDVEIAGEKRRHRRGAALFPGVGDAAGAMPVLGDLAPGRRRGDCSSSRPRR